MNVNININIRGLINFLIAFALGIAGGITFNNWQTAQLYRARQSAPHERGSNLLRQVGYQLDFTEEQLSEALKLFKSHQQNMEDLHKATQPKALEIQKKFRQAIRDLLTPEQQKKFDKLHEQNDPTRGGPGFPPHPGQGPPPPGFGPPPGSY